jgi:hypothetical protein
VEQFHVNTTSVQEQQTHFTRSSSLRYCGNYNLSFVGCVWSAGWKMAVQFILQVFGTKEIRSVTSKNMYSVALVLRKVEFP